MNSWTNSKGKKFIGDNATVPSPDDKSPVVVDYEEWHGKKLHFVLNGSIPSEANNEDVQEVAFGVIAVDENLAPLAGWEYEFSIAAGSNGLALTFSDIQPAPSAIGATAIFPAGVTAGQIGKIVVVSGGMKLEHSITVTA